MHLFLPDQLCSNVFFKFMKLNLSFGTHYYFLGCLLFVLLGCNQQAYILPEKPTANQLYHQALYFVEQTEYTTAITHFEKIIGQYPGTKYANLATLKMADSLAGQAQVSSLAKAVTYYEIYIQANPNSHLLPYALAQRINLNYERNEVFYLANSTDTQPYQQVIDDYQRFVFLHPKNLYLKDAQPFLKLSTEKLADLEEKIADWYYEQQLYPSAISRYNYVLKTFPNYTQQRQILDKLILTYEKNQQPEKIQEIKLIYQKNFANEL